MENQDFLPEHDADLQLAQALEKYRLQGEDLSKIDDPLIDSLLAYKQSYQKKAATEQLHSKKIWQQIERKTVKNPAPVFSLFKQVDVYRWAAAAAVLIAAVLGILWFSNLQHPALLLETQAEMAAIHLDDGSKVTLRPYSKLYRLTKDQSNHVYKISGEGYFEVQYKTGRRFIAETETGRVTVVGTKFLLSDWAEGTSVFLEEGVVQFETADASSSIVLEPGEYSYISGNEVQQPVRENSNIHKDWLNQVLVLDNQQVRYVISEIEHHFNITVTGLEDSDESLSGSIELVNVQQTLNDLGIVLGGTFRETGERQYRFISLQ